MPTISDAAIVLRRLDYSETSQVIVFFTREHGKVRAIAKGVKRSTKTRFAVGIDLLEVGRIVFSVRQERSASLAIVVEWKQSRSLFSLREKLFRMYGAQYAAELTAHLTEDWDPHVELHDALLNALTELCEASEPLRTVVSYQVALLRSIGSLPRFDACVLCGRAGELTYFSSIEGGAICRHCEPQQLEKRQVSPTALRVLLGETKPSSHVGAFDVLDYHIAHLMGREPLLAAKLVPPARRRIVD